MKPDAQSQAAWIDECAVIKANARPWDEKGATEWAVDYFRHAHFTFDPGRSRLGCVEAVTEWFDDLRDDQLRAALSDSVDGARKGERECSQVLRSFAAQLIKRGTPLPVPLRDFIVQFLDDPKASSKRGPNTFDVSARDNSIFGCIKIIVECWKFFPTRNAGTEPASAASIVHKALKVRGVPLSEKSINRIWTRYLAVSSKIPRID